MIVGDKVVFEKNENDTKKLNLLLDLDSTIIHSKKYKKNVTNDISYADDICSTVICEYESSHHFYHIHIRNNSLEFLIEMKKSFNIYIYTMGVFEYALSVCRSIEQLVGHDIFSGIIARDGDSNGQSKYFHVLNHLTIDNTIIVDDNRNVWIEENRKNLIKINQFSYQNYENYLIDNDLQILKDLIVNFKENIMHVGIHQVIDTIDSCYQSMK